MSGGSDRKKTRKTAIEPAMGEKYWTAHALNRRNSLISQTRMMKTKQVAKMDHLTTKMIALHENSSTASTNMKEPVLLQ